MNPSAYDRGIKTASVLKRLTYVWLVYGVAQFSVRSTNVNGYDWSCSLYFRELMKPERVGLINQSCATVDHSSLMVMLALFIVFIGAFCLQNFASATDF